jgi:CrcB protein
VTALDGFAARPLIALVAAGGAAGTLIRYAAGREWPTAAGDFPWTTLAVNLAGAFLLGLLGSMTGRRRPSNLWRRPLIGTGLLGGMTTFSTMAVEAVRLIERDRAATAAAYLAASAVLGVAAAYAGTRTAR